MASALRLGQRWLCRICECAADNGGCVGLVSVLRLGHRCLCRIGECAVARTLVVEEESWVTE